MKVVILSDGETYSDIDGCKVLEVPDWVMSEDLDTYVKDHADEGRDVV